MKKSSIQPLVRLKNAFLINSHTHSMVFDSYQTCYFAEGGYGGNTTFESVIHSIDCNGKTKVFAKLPHKLTNGMCELYVFKDILFVGTSSNDENLFWRIP